MDNDRRELNESKLDKKFEHLKRFIPHQFLFWSLFSGADSTTVTILYAFAHISDSTLRADLEHAVCTQQNTIQSLHFKTELNEHHTRQTDDMLKALDRIEKLLNKHLK